MKATTANRLKEVMKRYDLRQVDILKRAEPYCKQYGIKMGRNDLSQYVSGKVSPGQEKLTVLALALGVSETWLMGYDVPMDRSANTTYADLLNIDTIAFEITGRSLQHSPIILDTICKSFDELSISKDIEVFADNDKSLDFVDILKSSDISYDDKAYALKTVIDIVLLDIKKNEINILYKSKEDVCEDQLNRLILVAKRLNNVGFNKVIDYATDLSNTANYTKEISDKKVVHTLANQKQEHLIPIASHERTDIEVTEEMKKHDDAFFDE